MVGDTIIKIQVTGANMDNSVLVATNPNCKVEVVEIDSLYCFTPVHSTDFYNKIKQSIIDEGMKKPIVVVPTLISDWAIMYDINPKLYAPPELPYGIVVNRVACGHNRLQAAKELGYRYIEAYIAKDISDGSAVCKYQRSCL